MFDLPLAARSGREFRVEVPGLDDDWLIGAIVGPSGSGKTTIAREAFGQGLYLGCQWPASAAVVDAFGDLPIKVITQMLTAVGFSSPPAWVKPYAVLSNGEKFRCDLARALLGSGPLVAFDEFTSVVDRTVAKIGAAAVAKAIRSGRVKKRFVAVTCHYDVLDWLCPDWVVDMATCRLARGSLQRPGITIEVFRCGRSAWRVFAPHHYLSAALHHSAQCHLGCWDGRAVAFAAVLPVTGQRNKSRISRLVVLPDFQGVGIGKALLRVVAQLYAERGRAMFIRTSHPAMISGLARDTHWRTIAVARRGSPRQGGQFRRASASVGRAGVSFRFRGKTSVARGSMTAATKRKTHATNLDHPGHSDSLGSGRLRHES